MSTIHHIFVLPTLNAIYIFQNGLLWLSHAIGRHYVFMLVLEFFYLSDFFYISGRVTMSTLRISVCLSVCRQIKRTSTRKVMAWFSIFIHIWTEQDVKKKVMKRKFQSWNLRKIYRRKTKIYNMNFNSKSYKQICFNTSYFDGAK